MKHQTDQPYEQFFSRLTDFKTKHCTTNSTFKLNAWQELCEIYKDLEKQVDAMPKDDILENVRHTFKQQYYDFAKHSVLNSRVIDWPKGYQGDNITLEYLYKGYPVSEDLFGQYIDLYTISRTLGVGVRERKEKLKDILTKEMFQRDQTKFLNILNIGCGSSKELYEIGVSLNELNGKITCVDFDSEALNFSEITLASRMIDMKKFEFIKLNVLKLVDAQYMESTLGKFDLIYSVGLFDYIQDKGIIKLFQSLFTNLNKSGKIIASFKDSNYYSTFDYHWIGNWDGFYQRTKQQTLDLLQEALPDVGVQVIQSSIKAINYFVIEKE